MQRKHCIESFGPFWTKERLPERHRARLLDLLPHFTIERLQKIVVPFTAMRFRVSLRLLDWLVINYAKKFKVAIVSEKGSVLSIYTDYRKKLKYWKRSLFDAFRRGPRIYFDFEHTNVYETTIAQLNYLHWCEQSGVLRYMAAHKKEIELHMTNVTRHWKNVKQEWRNQGIMRKRCQLAEQPSTKCQVIDVPSRLCFEDPSALCE
jgi:hypothetical protein